MLEMRDRCEKCAMPLTHNARAFICSYECTFCAACSLAMEFTCPNCSGELLQRPSRAGGVQVSPNEESV